MMDANLPPNYKEVFHKLANPPAAQVQHYSTEGIRSIRGKSPLELMLVQSGASPKTVDGKVGGAKPYASPYDIKSALSAYQETIKTVNVHDDRAFYSKYKEFLERMKEPLEKIKAYDLFQVTPEEKKLLASAFGAYGLALNYDKNFKGAEEMYRLTLTLNPDDFDTNINLAYLLEKNLKRPEEAKPFARKAHTIRPNDSRAQFLITILGL